MSYLSFMCKSYKRFKFHWYVIGNQSPIGFKIHGSNVLEFKIYLSIINQSLTLEPSLMIPMRNRIVQIKKEAKL